MKRFFRHNNAKKGFTLVELIVVIAIVAILTAVSIAGYYGFMAYANQSAADQEATQFRKILVGQFSMNYNAQTSYNNGISCTLNSNGVRISNVTGESPINNVTSILAEAYTYSQSPHIFSDISNKDLSNLSYVIFDGNETDGKLPAFLNPKVATIDDVCYITEVTYQSTNKYKSVISFSNIEGIEVSPIYGVNMSKEATELRDIKGFKSEYYANELIDFSAVTATVVFSDGTSAIVGSDSLEITETTGTSLLHTRSVGQKRTFSIAYKQGSDQEPLVVNHSSDKGAALTSSDITTIELPLNIQQYIKTYNISEDSMAGFIKDAEDPNNGYYVVGNNNPFKFTLNISSISNDGKSVKIDPATLNDISYKIVNESNSEETILSFDSTNTGLDFADVEPGKYLLVASLNQKNISLKIRVIDAYNVYDIDGLKKFDNTRLTCFDYTTGTDRISTFEADPTLKHYISPYFKINAAGTDVEETGENDLSNRDIEHKELRLKGIVLQNSINVKPNHFRKSMFNSKGEIIRSEHEGPLQGNTAMQLFRRNLIAGEEFHFEGNYFTVDASSMPLMEYRHGYTGFWPELFSFGHDYGSEAYDHDVYGNQSWCQMYVERVNVIGNGGKIDNEIYTSSLMTFNNHNVANAVFNYVNIKKANYGINAYHHSYSMWINGCKISNCFTCTICDAGCGNRSLMARKCYTVGLYCDQTNNKKSYYPNSATPIVDDEARFNSIDETAGVHVRNSVLKDTGGPVIATQCTGPVNESWTSFPRLEVDSKSELTSYINGNEAYFTIYDMSDKISLISLLNGKIGDFTSNKYTLTSNEYYNCVTTFTPADSYGSPYSRLNGEETIEEFYRKDGEKPMSGIIEINETTYVDYRKFVFETEYLKANNQYVMSESQCIKITSDGGEVPATIQHPEYGEMTIEAASGNQIHHGKSATEITLAITNPNTFAMSQVLESDYVKYRAGILHEDVEHNLLIDNAKYLGIINDSMGILFGLFNK